MTRVASEDRIGCIGCWIDAPPGGDHRRSCHKRQERYSPSFAPHVIGRYTPLRMREDGLPEEQVVTIICTKCKSYYRVHCASGNVRQHIARFANVHYHGNPLR